jgi:uncharacterized membrane protein
MSTGRLEAFSDGVLAIIITIMVLELKVPEGHTFSNLIHTTGWGLLSYLLSFVYVGIYWNNHHHMFQLVDHVSGGVLWANLGLLFTLSLLPFTTDWMDSSHYAQAPVVTYGINLVLAAAAYYVLESVIIRGQGAESALRQAVGQDLKGRVSIVLYVAGIVCAAVLGAHYRVGIWLALGCFVAVAALWVVPDRRIDRAIRTSPTERPDRPDAAGSAG